MQNRYIVDTVVW